MFKIALAIRCLNSRALAAVLTSVVIAAGLFVRPALVGGAGPHIISSAMIPLSGTVFETQTNSQVSIEGTLHIVTNISPVANGYKLSVVTNLPAADVTATNQSGDVFLSYGAGTFVVMPIDLPNPLNSFLISFPDRFTLRNISLASSVVGPDFYGVALNLVFDAFGNLIPESSFATASKS